MKALLQKNFLRMWRNVGVMLFIFALPVMQVILFCLAIGRDPTGLKLAIINDEKNDSVNINLLKFVIIYNQKLFFHFQSCSFKPGCAYNQLGCRYLSHLNSSVIQEFYPDVDSALNAVKSGKAWGAIYVTENFTDALVARIALGKIFMIKQILNTKIQFINIFRT